MIACAFALSLLALYVSDPSASTKPASAPPKTEQPFAPGERFAYSIAWFRLGAGNAVLEVAESPPIHGRPTLKLLTTATSGPVVTKFYPVDNRVESVVDAASLRPHRFIFHRREGKKKNDFDFVFHHAEGKVAATKDGQTETLPIPPDTHDPISILYYVRSLPALTPGSSHVLNVHHDKKNYRVEIKVEAIEKVKGPWGKVEAIRILAIMPFQGIFLNEGNIQVWLTNDARRIPVMMKAKVVIGSVVARLVEGFQAP